MPPHTTASTEKKRVEGARTPSLGNSGVSAPWSWATKYTQESHWTSTDLSCLPRQLRGDEPEPSSPTGCPPIHYETLLSHRLMKAFLPLAAFSVSLPSLGSCAFLTCWTILDWPGNTKCTASFSECFLTYRTWPGADSTDNDDNGLYLSGTHCGPCPTLSTTQVFLCH